MENNNKPKLHISISKEHKENLPEIKEFFKDFDVETDAEFIRFSTGDLPMQIIIFIGSAVASGLVWDLIKLALKKTYEKFPKSRVTLRDKDSIMYSIKNDFKVEVIVIPDRKKKIRTYQEF